jgi:hypothetical protein
VSIAIPERCYFHICTVTVWLEPSARDQFLQAIAAELQGCEIGEGSVARAIGRAFLANYHPPLEADGQHAPKQLRKIGMRREEAA